MSAPPSARRDRLKKNFPKLVSMTNEYVYGDVWERQGLSKRDRSLVTVAALVASTPHHAWRQIAAIDAAGRTAHFHGARVKPAHNHAHAPDVVAIGNILANDRVPAAMAAAFAADDSLPLAERLLRGLEAGEAAGGEPGDLPSPSLPVGEREVFPLVDLRVDWHEAPIPHLRRLWEAYAPTAADYVIRAVDPDRAVVL